MFVLHGPVGQLFYKKSVAKKLWGRVMPSWFFPVWLLVVLSLSHIVNETFVKHKAVQHLASKVAKWLASALMVCYRTKETSLWKKLVRTANVKRLPKQTCLRQIRRPRMALFLLRKLVPDYIAQPVLLYSLLKLVSFSLPTRHLTSRCSHGITLSQKWQLFSLGCGLSVPCPRITESSVDH